MAAPPHSLPNIIEFYTYSVFLTGNSIVQVTAKIRIYLYYPKEIKYTFLFFLWKLLYALRKAYRRKSNL